jgi:hypothetical protein
VTGEKLSQSEITDAPCSLPGRNEDQERLDGPAASMSGIDPHACVRGADAAHGLPLSSWEGLRATSNANACTSRAAFTRSSGRDAGRHLGRRGVRKRLSGAVAGPPPDAASAITCAPAEPSARSRPARGFITDAGQVLASNARATPPAPHTMTTNGTTNGHHASRPLTAGIYAPIPTFFLPDSEELGARTPRVVDVCSYRPLQMAMA